MKPTLHPRLLNGRSGDPGLYVEALHLSAAVLFDCGDLSSLSARHLLRVAAVGVSHAHMDHWADFDRLLRLHVGRTKHLPVIGPPGFAQRLHHRLQSYTWNLVDRIAEELSFDVIEVVPHGPLPRHRMVLQSGFRLEELPPQPLQPDGLVLDLGPLALHATVLDHGTPSIGFALAERLHLNVWTTRLDERGLPRGPWLGALKQAVADGMPDDHPIAIGAVGPRPLGALRDIVTVTPGQRLAYLTDLADTPDNRARAIALARGADLLFIEAPFAAEDADIARDRCHLTTCAAGEIAREAGVRRVAPFHFSPRYQDEARLLAEVAAFSGLPVG